MQYHMSMMTRITKCRSVIGSLIDPATTYSKDFIALLYDVAKSILLSGRLLPKKSVGDQASYHCTPFCHILWCCMKKFDCIIVMLHESSCKKLVASWVLLQHGCCLAVRNWLHHRGCCMNLAVRNWLHHGWCYMNLAVRNWLHPGWCCMNLAVRNWVHQGWCMNLAVRNWVHHGWCCMNLAVTNILQFTGDVAWI